MRKNWKDLVFPLAGDLTLKGLGLSQEHHDILMNEVELVINCAASVNFDDPILDALNINYFGTMRLHDIVDKSISIRAFCHVSTAYVNSDKSGIIEEKIYDLDGG